MLHLYNGGFVHGTLVPSGRPETLRWQSPAFTAPLDFSLTSLSAVHLAVPAELPRPVGDYCFEMAGGDVAFGSLLTLDEHAAELEIAGLGRVRVDRSVINRMYRWRSSADLVYLGPNGLLGWQQPPGKEDWREEQGQPWTDREGAAIRGDFKLPARSTLEFEPLLEDQARLCFRPGRGRG